MAPIKSKPTDFIIYFIVDHAIALYGILLQYIHSSETIA